MFALKSALVGLAALAASAAFGSFDMLLQADSDTTLGEHIDRYDPVNRVYLGSFPVFGSVLALAGSSARGLAFVRTSTANIDIFNYSTGDYIRNSPLVGTSLALNEAQDKLYSISGGTLTILDLNTFSTSFITLSGQSTSSALCASKTGRFIVADDTSATIRSYSSTGAFLFSTTYIGFTNVKQIAERANSNAISNIRYQMATNLTTSLVGLNETVSSGSIGTNSTAITGFTSNTGIVSAHEGAYIIGVKTATPTFIAATKMSTTGNLTSSFNLSQTTSLTGQSAIVLAPEPGAFVALGFGIIPLLLKRKKK